MKEDKRFLVDVELNNLPFPMKVASKVQPDGQSTVANISVNARIMQRFEARWIDTFIQVLHRHRSIIGTKSLTTNINDYITELNASVVKVNFEFPFFVEKTTPVSHEKCLVRYRCTYSARSSSLRPPRIVLRIEVPVITTDPESTPSIQNRLFGQLSFVTIEAESNNEIYPEDIVEIVDRHALSPVYSFLTAEDQDFIIQKIHSEKKYSVVLVDEIKEELAHLSDISWFSVRCNNFGMLHSYSTAVGTEKSKWVPESEFDLGLDENI
jgi:GTP cyclohydrolase IB